MQRCVIRECRVATILIFHMRFPTKMVCIKKDGINRGSFMCVAHQGGVNVRYV